ncbi:MAG: hypothetical protein R3C49_22685 [Planctomycetaceae bacterium]
MSVSMSSKRRERVLCLCLVVVASVLSPLSRAQEADSVPMIPASEATSPREFSASDVATAQHFGQTLGIADWLGPLAPVALSPFFGILCLSGMSLYGKGWVSADNAFLGEGSPLHNPGVFWAFLILTLVTSLPRLTKVSKPFAQAVDQVEAWAGIITMLVLKIMVSSGDVPDSLETAMAQAGLGSMTLNGLLMIAAAVNILVINAVKFFFEVLIWITPVPAIDAMFEVANKAVCGALMAIYGYSPTLATFINLAMFIVCAMVFSWVYRREVFFRTMLLDAVLGYFFPAEPDTQHALIVFPDNSIGALPTRARCELRRTQTGWTLVQRRFLRSSVEEDLASDDCRMELCQGYFTNSLKLFGTRTASLSFSRRYNSALPELAAVLQASLSTTVPSATERRSGLKAEMT